jgi:hypothetical protein
MIKISFKFNEKENLLVETLHKKRNFKSVAKIPGKLKITR